MWHPGSPQRTRLLQLLHQAGDAVGVQLQHLPIVPQLAQGHDQRALVAGVPAQHVLRAGGGGGGRRRERRPRREAQAPLLPRSARHRAPHLEQHRSGSWAGRVERLGAVQRPASVPAARSGSLGP